MTKLGGIPIIGLPSRQIIVQVSILRVSCIYCSCAAGEVKIRPEWIQTTAKAKITKELLQVKRFAEKVRDLPADGGNDLLYECVILTNVQQHRLFRYWRFDLILEHGGLLIVDVNWQIRHLPACPPHYVSDGTKWVLVSAYIQEAGDVKLHGKEFKVVEDSGIVATSGCTIQLVEANDLLADPKRYLLDDTLSVVVEISLLEQKMYHADKQLLELMLGRKMFDAGEFTDVVLVAEGQEFTAHRAVVAARSDVLRAIFSTDM